ncbi:MAG: hypothetical protein ABEK04_03335 [Candidatus Nanohalobium sp.]
MGIVQTVQSLPQGLTSFILVGLLIAVLVVAYKLMEMVFETLTVAGLSGVFYGGLTYLFSPQMKGFEVNELLLFIFLGAALYIGYSFILSVYSATSTLIEIPIEMGKILLYPFKKLYTHHKKSKEEKQQEKSSSDQDQSTKEVVLDKMQEEDDDE